MQILDLKFNPSFVRKHTSVNKDYNIASFAALLKFSLVPDL